MRHGKKVIHLGRKTAHRKSMLANLGCSLIEHKRINTTVTKAKALKRFIEPIITKSKNDSTHNRRIAFSLLRDKKNIKDGFIRIICPSKVNSLSRNLTNMRSLDVEVDQLVEFIIKEFKNFKNKV